MYICICHGVTDKAIREAAESGVGDLAELSVLTGCAGSCGCCAELATQIIEEARALPLALAIAA
jgi:bacterioferritin-associated ferredoxin